MRLTNHSGAWAAEIEILEGPMSALKLAIGIFCRNRQHSRRTFTIGRALASGKYPEGLGEVEAWLENVAGSSELKHKVLAAVAVAVLRSEVGTRTCYLFAELIGEEKPFGREFEVGYRVRLPQDLRWSCDWIGEAKFADPGAAIAYAEAAVAQGSAPQLEIVLEDEWGNKTRTATVKPAGTFALWGDLPFRLEEAGLAYHLKAIEAIAVRHWGLNGENTPYEIHLENLEDLREEVLAYTKGFDAARVARAFGWEAEEL